MVFNSTRFPTKSAINLTDYVKCCVIGDGCKRNTFPVRITAVSNRDAETSARLIALSAISSFLDNGRSATATTG